MSPTQERRKRARKRPPSLVYVELASANGGMMRDLSEQGFAVRAMLPLQPGQTTPFAFSVDENSRVEGQGRVLWVEEGGRVAGIEFVQATPQLLEQVRQLLREASPKPAEPTKPLESPGSVTLKALQEELKGVPARDEGAPKEVEREAAKPPVPAQTTSPGVTQAGPAARVPAAPTSAPPSTAPAAPTATSAAPPHVAPPVALPVTPTAISPVVPPENLPAMPPVRVAAPSPAAPPVTSTPATPAAAPPLSPPVTAAATPPVAPPVTPTANSTAPAKNAPVTPAGVPPAAQVGAPDMTSQAATKLKLPEGRQTPAGSGEAGTLLPKISLPRADEPKPVREAASASEAAPKIVPKTETAPAATPEPAAKPSVASPHVPEPHKVEPHAAELHAAALHAKAEEPAAEAEAEKKEEVYLPPLEEILLQPSGAKGKRKAKAEPPEEEAPAELREIAMEERRAEALPPLEAGVEAEGEARTAEASEAEREPISAPVMRWADRTPARLVAGILGFFTLVAALVVFHRQAGHGLIWLGEQLAGEPAAPAAGVTPPGPTPTKPAATDPAGGATPQPVETAPAASPATSSTTSSASPAESNPAAGKPAATNENAGNSSVAPGNANPVAPPGTKDSGASPAATPAKTSERASGGTSGEAGSSEYQQAQQILKDPGRTKDLGEAVRLLWVAVEKGNVGAEITLAFLYRQGRGVEKNCDQTRILLKAAAKKGSRDAQTRLQEFEREGCE